MPTYYSSPNHHRQRTHSQSYYPSTAPQVVYTSSHRSHHSHHSPGHGHHYSGSYPQHGAYYTQAAPQYLTPNYQHDSGRHHHYGHNRTGSGGSYYVSPAPVQYATPSRHSPPHHHTTKRRSTSVHTTHRAPRSQSLPRQSVRTVDFAYDPGHRLRRSESRPRETVTTHNPSSHSHQRRASTSEPLGERIRRMFGFGGHSSGAYRDHRADYLDARTGRTVDWRGRPIYRV